MKLINTIKCDLNKSIINIGFVGAVLLTTVLAFTASAYTDSATERSYSVFEALFSLDKNILTSDPTLSSVVVFKNGLSGYITMFLPIIVAFPFMVSFCAERNNGLMRFTISRTGRLRYYISKFIASLAAGGLAVMLGIAVFGAACGVLFQPLSSFSVPEDQMQFVIQDSTGKTIFKMLAVAFCYGAISTLPAFFLSSFCKNPYIITCLPFMLNYVLTTMLNRIIDANLFNEDFDIDTVDALYPSSVTNFLYIQSFDRSAKWITAVNCSGAIVTLLGFIIVMNLRKDKGV
ncbi:hypothetical protein [uncultured Ruminococcus sp.]|uniref:hypothetical protein n=1 Tax=uncultured Ruminococcus sp. TaxID=165186 RepID=UPI0025CCB0B6|nr:hypothetical protein [uncultured Ruminococcus sp.]